MRPVSTFYDIQLSNSRVYRYLHSLYIRWKKPALAQKYKGKYLESSKNKLKISP